MSALLLAFERRASGQSLPGFESSFPLPGGPLNLHSGQLRLPIGGVGLAELPAERSNRGGPGLATGADGQVALVLDGRVDAWGSATPTPSPALSDAERLLQRWLVFGEGFLEGVRGSYVVALLDARLPLALAARDALGNRYAAYALNGDRFALAGDDATLLSLPGVSGRIDPLRLAEFYASEELCADETFFEGVRALRPGEMLVVEGERHRHRIFDRIDLAARFELPAWEDYVEAFAERLTVAVERSLRGVSRATAWLSGGLDSGPLAALAARRLANRGAGSGLVGLCWRVGHAAGDELDWARQVGEHAGFPVEAVPCEEADPFRPLADWPVRASTPEQTAYRRYHELSYARARALGAQATLWGFGGDMLYAAPRRWFWDLWAAAGVGPALDRLREAAAERGWRRVLRSEVIGPLVRRRPAPWRRAPSWLTAQARERLEHRPAWPPGRALARRPRQAERLLALLDGFGTGVERADAARHGLALASPLRDRDLVEMALAVPDHLLFQGAETRPVLRAAARGLVPESVRRRRGKATFHAAVERALRPENRPWAGPLLRHPDALWRGYVEPAAIERWLERCPTGDDDDFGFTLAIFGELWRRKRAGEDLGALDQSSAQ